jgi:hypothetical protein
MTYKQQSDSLKMWQFSCLETTAINQNLIHEEIMRSDPVQSRTVCLLVFVNIKNIIKKTIHFIVVPYECKMFLTLKEEHRQAV